MKILVYPHAMEIGGSQLNAIELAGAVRDLGHDVWVYAPPGQLRRRVRELHLPMIPTAAARRRPSLRVARHLSTIVAQLGIDVVHGYEWPPILEAYAATRLRGTGTTAVGTIMSMSVAPFIPSNLPLVVGTAEIQSESRARRRGEVALVEPPVDTKANQPGGTHRAVPPDLELSTPVIVVVCSLVKDLKLEGILTAIRAVRLVALERPLRLVIVGDGAARGEVEAAAGAVNKELDCEAVVLTGELEDPRAAYDSADVCIGMGGSALRALAFGKPLVVQGELGFFEILSPETVDVFLRQGWYGVGDLGPDDAAVRLSTLLRRLLDNRELRVSLGRFGRQLVESRFSLEKAATTQVEFYSRAISAGTDERLEVLDLAQSGLRLVEYKIRRRLARFRGTQSIDDFNIRPARLDASRPRRNNVSAKRS